MSVRRRAAVLTAALAFSATSLGGSAFSLAAAPPAAAEPAATAVPAKSGEGYRYWSFWEAKEKGQQPGRSGRGAVAWTFATKGPDRQKPADGSVLGFRFALSSESGDAAKPRGDAAFDSVCGDTAKKPGRKRVALDIDFGIRAHAPHGEQPPKRRTACARVPEDATAADALAATAKPLRYGSNALLCSISGYPKQGCADRASADDKGGKDGKGSGKDGGSRSGGGSSSASGEGSGAGSGLSTGAGIGAGVAVVVVLAAAATWQVRRRR